MRSAKPLTRSPSSACSLPAPARSHREGVRLWHPTAALRIAVGCHPIIGGDLPLPSQKMWVKMKFSAGKYAISGGSCSRHSRKVRSTHSEIPLSEWIPHQSRHIGRPRQFVEEPPDVAALTNTCHDQTMIIGGLHHRWAYADTETRSLACACSP